MKIALEYPLELTDSHLEGIVDVWNRKSSLGELDIQCGIIKGDNIYNTSYVCTNTRNPHIHAFHSILQLLLVHL